MSAHKESQPRTKERFRKGLEYGGLIGAIIGLATFSLEIIVFSSAAAIYGSMKKEKKSGHH